MKRLDFIIKKSKHEVRACTNNVDEAVLEYY